MLGIIGLSAISLYQSRRLIISPPIFICCFFLLTLSTYTAFISVFISGSIATASVGYFINISVCMVLGGLFYIYRKKRGNNVEEMIEIVLSYLILCTFINGVIILCEYFIPPLRWFIESILASNNSNIDYLERDNRFRGLASGGAANLSLLYGISLVGIYNQYLTGKIKLVRFAVSFIVILLSCLLIGRTGLVITIVGIVALSFTSIYVKNISSSKASLFFLAMAFILPVLPVFLSQYMTNYMLDYALMFLYGGVDGIKNEGTIDILASMTTYPDGFIAALIGVGSDSGGFLPNTRSDSGYLKMFTALGYPISILFYVSICMLYVSHIRKLHSYKWLLFVFVGAWFFSEIKEPFIFKGYTARFLWFVLSLLIVDGWCNRKSQRC
ncbi:hypothetical protein ACET6E_04825 [Aeromonas caviae]|uniref:hypothetical protein n=1 Tax=Aeromonas caviae TaxID=648 RepID=UPI0038D23857